AARRERGQVLLGCFVGRLPLSDQDVTQLRDGVTIGAVPDARQHGAERHGFDHLRTCSLEDADVGFKRGHAASPASASSRGGGEGGAKTGCPGNRWKLPAIFMITMESWFGLGKGGSAYAGK